MSAGLTTFIYAALPRRHGNISGDYHDHDQDCRKPAGLRRGQRAQREERHQGFWVSVFAVSAFPAAGISASLGGFPALRSPSSVQRWRGVCRGNVLALVLLGCSEDVCLPRCRASLLGFGVWSEPSLFLFLSIGSKLRGAFFRRDGLSASLSPCRYPVISVAFLPLFRSSLCEAVVASRCSTSSAPPFYRETTKCKYGVMRPDVADEPPTSYIMLVIAPFRTNVRWRRRSARVCVITTLFVFVRTSGTLPSTFSRRKTSIRHRCATILFCTAAVLPCERVKSRENSSFAEGLPLSHACSPMLGVVQTRTCTADRLALSQPLGLLRKYTTSEVYRKDTRAGSMFLLVALERPSTGLSIALMRTPEHCM